MVYMVTSFLISASCQEQVQFFFFFIPKCLSFDWINAGFDEKTKFRTCCGYGDNPYNYSPNISCGTNPEAKACNKPDEYMSWDGIHFTDAFSQRFVKEMMKGRPYLRPPRPSLLGGHLIH